MDEVVAWSCKNCHAEATTSSRYRKPDVAGCTKKKHDWKLGTSSERHKTKISLVESSQSSQRTSRREPEHFSDAQTWEQADELLAPWAEFEIESGTAEGIEIFSNVGSIAGALRLYQELQGSASWARGKRLALTAVTSNAHLLQHVGALAATVVTSTTTFELFAVAANLYRTCDGTPGPWVFETLKQDNCGGGTCHTEQICLWRLHRHLLTLRKPPSSIRLQWYTEKVMCDLWCVPTLSLFIEYWGRQGTEVESIPSAKLF